MNHDRLRAGCVPAWMWGIPAIVMVAGIRPGFAPARAQTIVPAGPAAAASPGGPGSGAAGSVAAASGGGGIDVPQAAETTPTGEQRQREAEVTKVLSRALGLEDSPVSVYGWIQNSYTGTPGISPRNGSTVTVFPNRLANAWQGNQYYLILENPLESGSELNAGFRFDTLFGNDWMITKSFGLFDGAFTPLGFAGVDFPQIYGDLHLPLAEKVEFVVRGGRFYSPAGFESIQAVKRPLLSIPYLTEFTPFTFLGALTNLQLGDRLTITNAAVNGTDRWFNQNYHYSYLGGVNWNSSNGRNTFASFTLVGPNQLPFFPSTNPQQTPTLPVGAYFVPGLQGKRNPLYNRSTLVYHSSVFTHKWGEKQRLTQAMEVFFITEGNVLGYGRGGGVGRISYYGGAHWLLYEVAPNVTAVARHEVFADPNGFVFPAPDNHYEMTYGLIIKPRPCLWIRPEIRYDWAQFTRPYNDGTRSGELTLACDVIVQF
ncbi:MAG: outer membrane beta-barrel protein [Isosphaeraceae bacterium]